MSKETIWRCESVVMQPFSVLETGKQEPHKLENPNFSIHTVGATGVNASKLETSPFMVSL